MPVYKPTYLAGMLTVLCCAIPSAVVHAQIVSHVSGEIDLTLRTFTAGCVSGFENCSDQIALHPVTGDSIDVSIDGTGFPHAGGLSRITLDYVSAGAGDKRIDMYAFVVSDNASDGSGGQAQADLQLTISAPFRYRFESAVIGVPDSWSVTFNGQQGTAWYDGNTGLFGGTFPPVYQFGNPLPTGWDTYIDQGVLPAGVYDVSVFAFSSLNGLNGTQSEGTASLTIQLLGDANLDGVVGLEDLNAVLASWNHTATPGDAGIGDLNGDGFVGINDLNEVLGNWNADVRPPVAATAIPEPAGVAIATLLSLTMVGRCRSRSAA